jgi:phosphoribosylanthranilate isomerase
MTGLIKICGLKQTSHVVVAAASGADLIGLNFAASKRHVAPEVARELVLAAKEINPLIRTVGLFVDATVDEIHRTHEVVGFDLGQIHGLVNLDELADLPVPFILPVRVEPGGNIEELRAFAESAIACGAEFVLFDGYHPTLAGGTGIQADWGTAASFARDFPVMLAGGLNAENVVDAISTVRPLGVDVSSGVEKNGVKDPVLMRAFIANARAAFAQSTSSGTSSQDAP